MIYAAEWRDNVTARNSNRKVMLFVSPSQFPISFKEIVPTCRRTATRRVWPRTIQSQERFPLSQKLSNPFKPIPGIILTLHLSSTKKLSMKNYIERRIFINNHDQLLIICYKFNINIIIYIIIYIYN